MNYRDAGVEDIKQDVMEWLDHVWRLIQSDRAETLRPVPYYARRELLTDEKVDQIVEVIESYLLEEITRYPGYHNTQQGLQPGETLTTPGFNKLPPLAKRALVERFDELCQAIRVEAAPVATAVEGGC
jgi:hypothetical protein